ncbi:MAG: hypothetical protein IPK19_25995 [Chloroflexi bacterium]|nr:hypothetical protein [Chloroflexota bacterium]
MTRLSETEFHDWAFRLGLSQSTVSLITHIRSSEPSRRVGGGAGNVTVRFPSKKMGCVIQAESHKVSFAGVIEYEHDKAILEYYDESLPIKLNYKAKSGRQIGVLHTPDYFLIQENGAGWEEWKTEEELNRLAEDMPNRYMRDENGQWRCPPGEEYASEHGLAYTVRSSSGINWTYQRNLSFLDDYWRHPLADIPEDVRETLVSHVARNEGIDLDTLRRQFPDQVDKIAALIFQEALYCDLENQLLIEPQTTSIFSNRDAALAYSRLSEVGHPTKLTSTIIEAGAAVDWDGKPWTIANAGESRLALLSQDNELMELSKTDFLALVSSGSLFVHSPEPTEAQAEIREILRNAGPADIAEANRRYNIIQGNSTPSDVSERTVRAWKASFRQAKEANGNGYLGLLPKTKERGNRAKRIPSAIHELMDTFISENYETLKQKRFLSLMVSSCNNANYWA